MVWEQNLPPRQEPMFLLLSVSTHAAHGLCCLPRGDPLPSSQFMTHVAWRPLTALFTHNFRLLSPCRDVFDVAQGTIHKGRSFAFHATYQYCRSQNWPLLSTPLPPRCKRNKWIAPNSVAKMLGCNSSAWEKVTATKSIQLNYSRGCSFNYFNFISPKTDLKLTTWSTSQGEGDVRSASKGYRRCEMTLWRWIPVTLTWFEVTSCLLHTWKRRK